MLEEVLQYRDLGWSLIPIAPGTKSPLPRDWTRYRDDRRAPLRDLKRWFSSSDVGIAVVCGKLSGNLAVRDFDHPERYFEWGCKHPELAKSAPTVRTPKGFHVFVKIDPDDPNLPRGISPVVQGTGDTLRIGHFSILPPSQHPEGGIYRWEKDPFKFPVPFVSDIVASGLWIPYSKMKRKAGKREPLTSVVTLATAPANLKSTAKAVAELLRTAQEVPDEIFRKLLKWLIPTHSGIREQQIWATCRFLKSFREFQLLNNYEMRNLYWWWYREALPYVSTKNWSDTLTAFERAWERALPEAGEEGSAATSAIRSALKNRVPEDLRKELSADEPAGILAGICKGLQEESDSDRFFLPRDTAQKWLNDVGIKCAAGTVSRWIHSLKRLGIIFPVSLPSKSKNVF